MSTAVLDHVAGAARFHYLDCEMQLAVRNLGVCPYPTALALQEELVRRRAAAEVEDQLLLLEHLPVYTLGRGADADDLRGADQILGVPVFRVGRGGGATFHGRGQLIAYPIVMLRHGGRDVHGYVRALEAVLIGVCAEFGIAAEGHTGLTGVWVGGAKIASIGIGVRRWTTFHGIALNVSTDLRYFAHIVPCRMPDVRMTSMAVELGAAPSMEAVTERFVRQFRSAFGYDQTPGVQAYGA